MRLKFLLAGVLLTALLACQKKNSRINYNNGIEGAKTYVAAQQMMTQLLNTYFKCLTDSTLIATGHSKVDGADIIYSTPPTESIFIKYPVWGNHDGYGHFRINTYDAVPRTSFSDPEVTVDITFNKFLFDKDTLNVQNLVVESLGKTDGQNEHYKVSAGKIELIYSDTTGMISCSFNEEYVRHKDPGSIYTSPDDYFLVNGTFNGMTKGKVSYNSTITADSAIKFNLSCNWLKGGVVTVETTPFNYSSFVYFPEQDTCMNEYDVVINGDPFTYPIDM